MKKLKITALSFALIFALTALIACTGQTGTGTGDQSDNGSTVIQNIDVNFNVVESRATAQTPQQEKSLKEVLKDIRPSVVEVYATTENQSSSSQTEGSGVVIACAKLGENIYVSYIATCYSIVAKSSSLSVIDVDGNEYTARPIGADDQTDICVIGIMANLPAVTFAASKDVEVGEDVVAIGNPLGTIGGTVTKGIIGAVNYDVVVDNVKVDLFQTDAAVNVGNSGGGLFLLDGSFVGLVNAKYLNSYDTSVKGLSFVTPSDTVKDISEKLMETYTGTSYGYVPGRYYLGCTVINKFTSTWLTTSYVSINTIDSAGSFYKGGLREGDRIISVEYKGQEGTESEYLDQEITISTVTQFAEVLDSFNIKVGDHIIFNVRRGQYTGFLDVEILQYVVGAE